MEWGFWAKKWRIQHCSGRSDLWAIINLLILSNGLSAEPLIFPILSPLLSHLSLLLTAADSIQIPIGRFSYYNFCVCIFLCFFRDGEKYFKLIQFKMPKFKFLALIFLKCIKVSHFKLSSSIIFTELFICQN